MKNDTESRRSIILGWIVLGLIVAIMPVQAIWYVYSGAEPYPALSQPGFQKIYGGADGIYSGQSTSLSVILSDGSAVPIQSQALFSESENQALPTIEFIKAHPDLDARSREKLRAELKRLVPDREISYLRIDSQPAEYSVEENRRHPLAGTETIVVDLRDQYEADS
jgi:hypothetical protein